MLSDILKNAGEVEKKVDDKPKKVRNANLANEMVYNAGLDYVVEMAQQHFDNEIFDLIQQGKYEEAANRYIENQQAKGYKVPKKPGATVNKLKRGEFSKGFTASQEKAGEITNQQWDEFSKAYENIMGGTGKREYKKRKGTEDPKGGIITSQSSMENAKKLRKKLQMLAQEYKKVYDEAESEEARQEALAHISGLRTMFDALGNTLRGKPTLPPETEKEIQKLKDRYEKIGKKFEKQAEKADPDDDEVASDEERAEAMAKLRSRLRGFTDPEDVEGLWKDWLERKRRIEAEKFGKARMKDPDESLSLRGKILAEGMDYHGTDFWKNYVMTSVMKGFAKDLKVLGEDAKYLYMEVFGVETAPIFEYMEEHRDSLNEVVQYKNTPLLFELHGSDAESLKHAPDFTSKSGGFLSGLWDKIKKFGAPIVSRLSKLIEAGASWAKNIAEKGIGWIGSSPVAQVAVPAVVLAGTTAGAVALINKIRKKKKQPKLSKEEKAELERTAQQRKPEIEKYQGKKSDQRDAWSGDEEDFDLDLDDDEEQL